MPTASAPSVRNARISAGVSKLGPGGGEVDALGQRDVRARRRRRAAARAQLRVVGVAQAREARADRVVVRAGERVDAEHVDVVADRHQRARARPRRRSEPAALVTNSASAPGAPSARAPGRASRRGRRPRRRARGPAGTATGSAGQRAERERAGVAGDARLREVRQLGVGDRDGVLERVGDRAEAGAEDDPEPRRGARSASDCAALIRAGTPARTTAAAAPPSVTVRRSPAGRAEVDACRRAA